MEGKIIETVLNEEYVRAVLRIGYYLKSKNMANVFKYKCPTLATGWDNGRIYLLTSSLEHMGSLCGHKGAIECLCPLSSKILASGSSDKTIKIWGIEERAIMSTLSGHTNSVMAICHMNAEHLVSRSMDNSLIIWSKLPGSNIYSPRHVQTGYTSGILGIIKINNSEIVSGERNGDLKIWNIDRGICTRYIPSMGYNTAEMKQYMGEVAVSYSEKVIIWGVDNNWRAPLKQFSVCQGWSIEFLSGDILLRGGHKGELEFIDYAQTGCSMPPIQGLHSRGIDVIQRIAKDIVITASRDRFMKVIDPISRKCYLKFTKGDLYLTAVAYLY